jgi:hypothetical protein
VQFFAAHTTESDQSKIRQKIRLRRVEQSADFRWRVNLNIASLDLVGPERIGIGLGFLVGA